MKLIWRIILRVALLMLVVFPLWGFFFYQAIINEVNDETDDNLELYAEQLVREFLTNGGRAIGYHDNGTNNTYTIDSLTTYTDADYCVYSNEIVYVPSKGETEPARVLRMTFSDSSQGRFLITVMTPTIETDDLIEAILNWITLLFIVLSIVILVIIWLIVARSVRPLYKLLNWIESYRLGESSSPLDNYTDILEFSKLNDAAITFSLRSEQLFEQQKQFIGNASHEIQTPIAVCQNRLELLCDTELSEHQLTEIVKTRKTLEYISRLNKSLLLLTKIDNRQFIDQSSINIVDIVRKSIEDYTDIYSYRSLDVSTNYSVTNLNVTMNQTLATTLISNLIRNAFIHNSDRRSIRVEVSECRLSITNSAQNGPLDKTHIFERFWRSSDREGSTGLGLPIAQAIARYYRFNIEYDYIDNYHRFTVNFT